MLTLKVPLDAFFSCITLKNILMDVKGIGSGTAKNLVKNGITSVDALLDSDPEQLASKISGISSKMISEWQVNAIVLIGA